MTQTRLLDCSPENGDSKDHRGGDSPLRSVDWDFRELPPEKGIHSIHPYPARFIPSIPRRLIEIYYPKDSSAILDPFCGSGTTLVEGIRAGINAYGIDVNPLACLIARVKTRPLPVGLGQTSSEIINEARVRLANDEIEIPRIPRLDHWFEPSVQRALAALTQQINQQESINLREPLQVALSSIIVQVSNQESNTRYAAVEKNVSAKDVLLKFGKAVPAVGSAISGFFADCKRFGKATILNRDVLTMASDDLPSEVGLVVTSPPYPNAYEYWLYHKYRMYWLGMDPVEVREREIGARPHYFKKNSQDERDFERQMGYCFQLLSRVMQPDAKACFLVGRSIIHGREIDNSEILQRASEPHGFGLEDVAERRIPSTRKSFNPVHGRISKEHLMVFSLEACA